MESRDGTRDPTGGFVEGFGVWRSGAQRELPPPGHGSTQSHACGAEHVCGRGGGRGKGGQVTLAQVGAWRGCAAAHGQP